MHIDKKWWKEAVVYQVYPRSFKDSNGDGIGDLQGIISKVSYLEQLGIDVVWLSPHFDSPNADNGYDIRDYTKVMQEFGTMEDFELLLNTLHQRGIKLIIDLVVNHSSDEHYWFQQSKSSTTNPYRDYYIWHEGKHGEPPNNWTSFFGGSAWEQAGKDGAYYLHYFDKKQPDLNWENTKVREEVHDIMRFWLDKGIDGFRMDVIPFISKHQDFRDLSSDLLAQPENYYTSGPRLHEFLQEMNEKVLSHYDVMTVGEAFGGSPELVQLMTDERRKEIDLAFLFDVIRIGRNNWKQGEWTLPEWKALFKIQSNLDAFHWPTVFLGNHDNPRVVSTFGNDSAQFRTASAKLLAMLVLTQRGTPFIYQGDEIGMTNYPFTAIDQFDDVEVKGNYHTVLENGTSSSDYLAGLNQTSRDHSRTPFQWSSEPFGGFTTGPSSWFLVHPNHKEINVENELANPDSVLHFYKMLIRLRKEHEDLIYGDYQDISPEHSQLFAYTRKGKKSTFLIVLNMSNKTASLKVQSSCIGFSPIANNLNKELPEITTSELHFAPWEASLYISN